MVVKWWKVSFSLVLHPCVLLSLGFLDPPSLRGPARVTAQLTRRHEQNNSNNLLAKCSEISFHVALDMAV